MEHLPTPFLSIGAPPYIPTMTDAANREDRTAYFVTYYASDHYRINLKARNDAKGETARIKTTTKRLVKHTEGELRRMVELRGGNMNDDERATLVSLMARLFSDD
jgi:hypothetical protein